MSIRKVVVLSALAATLIIPAQAQASQKTTADARQAQPSLLVPGTAISQPLAQHSFFSTLRKIAKCAVGVAAFVVGNTLAISKLRKAGGVWKVARKLWSVKGKTGKLKVLASIFGEVSGLNSVAEACGV